MKQVGAFWVYLTVLLVVVIRLFTETLGLVPRVLNGIDLVLIPVGICGVLGHRVLKSGRIAVPVWVGWITLFIVVWAVSTIINIDQILPAASILYLVGHLLPILFGVAVYNLDMGLPFARRVVWLLEVLALLQVIVAVPQISQVFDNPDALSTTFGANANQTVFFLSLVLSLLLARWIAGTASAFHKVLVVILLPLFFLAGFKAMWVLYPLVVVVVLLITGVKKVKYLVRKARLGVVVLLIVGGIVTVLPLPERHNFEGFRSFDTTDVGKFQAVMNLPEVWFSRPWALLVGVGPGTLYSRAFRTFAALPISGGASDVAGGIVEQAYMTPLAERLVIPLLFKPSQLGSGTIEYPFSSYLSLIAETGLLGFVAMMALYYTVARRLLRRAKTTRDPEERTLTIAALMALLTLLAVSVIDNYLENTRLASLVWVMVSLAWIAQKAESSQLLILRASVPIPRDGIAELNANVFPN